MGLLLRIDVDNPYGYRSKKTRLLNRIALNYELLPRLASLGYLADARSLCSYLNKNGIPANWFFRTISVPTKKMMPQFQLHGSSVALHSERSSSSEDFRKEVQDWTKKTGFEPKGFSKHGSGELKLSRHHDPKYDPDALLSFGGKQGMKFFVGNNTDYTMRPERIQDILYIPSIFWLDRRSEHPEDLSLDDVIKASKRDSIVVLIHPVWWTLRESVREDLHYLVKRGQFISISEYLSEFSKKSR